MPPRGLVLDHVTIDLAGRRLLAIDRTVAPGEVLTVMGPSGSGKSSLISWIAGFLDPAFTASGRVSCDGVALTELPAELRRAGILFQDPLLFPHMSVLGNLLFALPPEIRSRAERRRVAEAALADVGLDGFGARDPDTLSGGEKARVALARVLVSAPRLLLLDEPFSRLDAELRQQIRSLVFDAAHRSGLATVLVTHDSADAEAAGGPVVEIGR